MLPKLSSGTPPVCSEGTLQRCTQTDSVRCAFEKRGVSVSTHTHAHNTHLIERLFWPVSGVNVDRMTVDSYHT